MKNVLFVCNAGMSTSLLIKKVETTAKEMGLEFNIKALPMSEVCASRQEADVILLGPQVRFGMSRVKEAYTDVPVEAIEPMTYGTMNAAKIISQITRLLGQ